MGHLRPRAVGRDRARHPPAVSLGRTPERRLFRTIRHTSTSRAGSYAWKPILLEEAARGRRRAGVLVRFGDHAQAPPLTERSHACARARASGRCGVRRRSWAGPIARVMDAAGAFPLEVLHLPERVTGAIGFDTRHAVANTSSRTGRDWPAIPRIHPAGRPRPAPPLGPDVASAASLPPPGEAKSSSTRGRRHLVDRSRHLPHHPQQALDQLAALDRSVPAPGTASGRQATGQPCGRGVLEHPRRRSRWAAGASTTPCTVATARCDPGSEARLFRRPLRTGRGRAKRWLFVERFDYPRNKGRIVAIDRPRNASYPVTGEGLVRRVLPATPRFPSLVERGGQPVHDTRDAVSGGRRSLPMQRISPEDGGSEDDCSPTSTLPTPCSSARTASTTSSPPCSEGEDNRHLEIYYQPRCLWTLRLNRIRSTSSGVYAAEQFGTGRCGGFLGFDD